MADKLFLILALSVCICVAPDSWDLSFDRIMNFTNADEANVKGKALTDQDQESVGYFRLSMVSMFEKWCDVADDDGKPPSVAITPKHDNRASSSVGKGTISEEEHYRCIVQDALVAKVDYDAHDQNGKLEGNTSDESYCSLPHRADKSPPRQWDKGMIIFLVVTGWLLCRRMDTNLVQVKRQLHAEMQLQASKLQTLDDNCCRRIDQNGRRIDQYGRRMDQNANQMADLFRDLTTEIQGHRLRQQINNNIADARQVNTENYSLHMLKRVVKIDKNVRQLPQNIIQLQAARQGDHNLENSLPAVDQDFENRMYFD